MSLRRSARLQALPRTELHQTVAAATAKPQPQQNGIVKAKKRSSRTTTAKNVRRKDALPAFREPPSSYSISPTTQPLLVAESLGIDDITCQTTRTSTPPPLDRPVDPHRTNATLMTPRGSSVVAYPPGAESVSPSKTGLPRPTATAGTLLDQAVAHLIATDPRLKPLVDRYPCPLFSPAGLAEEVDPFRSLVSSIIGQQVSGAAAKSIKDKFIALFNDRQRAAGELDADGLAARVGLGVRFPTPSEVAACDLPTLRTAGLSQRKAEYIQGLAEKFSSGELSAGMLLKCSDEDLLDKLTAVRGLGKWSVEMFACFALKRMDVFSTGDLGVQRGCAAFMGRDVNKIKAKGGGKFKYMSEKDMLDLAAKFAPYRSLFMWYMWRVENVDIAVMNTT